MRRALDLLEHVSTSFRYIDLCPLSGIWRKGHEGISWWEHKWHEQARVVLVTQLCSTLCDPMDHSPPGSSILVILQAMILEWVVIPFSRGSSRFRDWTQVSCIADSLPSLHHWTTWIENFKTIYIPLPSNSTFGNCSLESNTSYSKSFKLFFKMLHITVKN